MTIRKRRGGWQVIVYAGLDPLTGRQRQLTQTTSRGTRTSDHQELIGWARQRWPERTWAVEDCRHVAGRLLADLLAAGERVVLVPPRLMAQTRQASRVPG
ncbi:MAG TPA: hypothetical protein VFC13_26910, partial [Actinomycetes bacterium]|nr:hypothetical protein [Actinomycetes bacterium]